MHLIVNIFIALVWLVNGLLCKLFNLVPRHQMIVQKILGYQYGVFITKIIGISEILMSVWVISNIESHICSIIQIVIIMIMNIIEFFYARRLLLFGRMNIVIAILLCCIIYLNTFAV
ncbi:MAG: DoxX-like family protein [Parafilimonas sp.]